MREDDLLNDVLLRGARLRRLTLHDVRFGRLAREKVHPVMPLEQGREDQSHHRHDGDAPMSGAMQGPLPRCGDFKRRASD